MLQRCSPPLPALLLAPPPAGWLTAWLGLADAWAVYCPHSPAFLPACLPASYLHTLQVALRVVLLAAAASIHSLARSLRSRCLGPSPLQADAAVAGTVVVRDAASRLPVAHFRAHTSPLVALQFSPGGTLLASASVAGHSINVFRIVPPAAGGSGMAGSSGGGHAVHLYRLHRGVTPAAIRGISFAPDAAWVAVSSSRGTTHLFHTPFAAPGARPPPQQAQAQQGAASEPADAAVGEAGVVGRPAKLPAVGRARKAGLLSSGVAGAATSAARNLYSGGASGTADPARPPACLLTCLSACLHCTLVCMFPPACLFSQLPTLRAAACVLQIPRPSQLPSWRPARAAPGQLQPRLAAAAVAAAASM
jgi:hypothetical protein